MSRDEKRPQRLGISFLRGNFGHALSFVAYQVLLLASLRPALAAQQSTAAQAAGVSSYAHNGDANSVDTANDVARANDANDASRPLGRTLQSAWRGNIVVGTPSVGRHVDWLKVAGRVTYDEEHTQFVTSPLNGRVVAVHAKVGDAVAEQQPLLTLASPEAAQYKADLQQDREDLHSAEANRKRTRALAKDGAVSAREAVEAEATYNKAYAAYTRDAAHLQALGLDLAKPGSEAQLVARQAGVVTTRHVFFGQQLRAEAGEPLMTLSDLNQVWIQADVYERDVAQVVRGAAVKAQVLAYPDAVFTGEVSYVGDVVDAQTRSVKVRCQLANRDRRLKPEMFATVCLQALRPSALTVPSEAVVVDGGVTYVVAVEAGDALALRRIEVGPLAQGNYPVYTGLQADQRILLRGALYVLQASREL